jgi:tetratricopeptide (TPR) repeat protein
MLSAPWLSKLPSLGRFGPILLLLFPWAFAFGWSQFGYEHFLMQTLGSMLNIVALSYTAAFAVVLVHECGHWILGHLVGIRINRLVVGDGEPCLDFSVAGIHFTLRQWMCSGFVQHVPTRHALQFWPQAVYNSGGVLFVTGFLIAASVIPKPAPSSLSLYWANLYLLKFMILAAGGIGVWASLKPRMVWVGGQYTPNDALLIVRAWKRRHQVDQDWQLHRWAVEANALLHAKQFQEARSLVEKMLAVDPDDEHLRRNLAHIDSLMGEFDRAVFILETIAQAKPPGSPERAMALDSAASTALKAGRRELIEKARAWAEEAVKISNAPTLAGTFGSVLVELGETKAGIVHLNRCVAETDEANDRAIANAYLAKAARQLNKTQRAKELIELARCRCPDHPLVQRIAKEFEMAELKQHSKVVTPQ